MNKKNTKEIPVKKYPHKNIPVKDPNIIPDTKPSKNNPINPKEDQIGKNK